MMADERIDRHPDPLPDDRERGEAGRAARRVILHGAVVLIVSLLIMFSPLLLGRNGLNKYIVAFAIIGACAGLSFMLHGAVDWFRGRA